MKFLQDALVLQIENKREQLLTQGVNEDKLQDEISVALMADLQEKQATESTAMTNVLADKVRNFKNGKCVVMFWKRFATYS